MPKFINNRGALLNITRQECVIVRLDTLSEHKYDLKARIFKYPGTIT